MRGDRPVLAPLAVAEVAGDANAELGGERPIVLGHAHRAELIAARREEERDQLIVARQTSLAQTADVIRGMVKVARRLPMTMAATVPEHDTPAGRKVCIDRRVGVLGRIEIVAPVDQRRDAGIESFQAAEKIAGVGVFGSVKGR